MLATPSVRKLAREKKVSLLEIKGTGKNGRITREDVLDYASKEKQAVSREVNIKNEEKNQPLLKRKQFQLKSNT